MKNRFLFSSLVILLFVPATGGVPQTSPHTQSADAYAVYSALIPHISQPQKKKFLISADTVLYAESKSRFPVEPEDLVTREEFDRQLAKATSSEYVKIWKSQPCLLAPKAEREAYLSAMMAYRRKNETSLPLERKLDLPMPYELARNTGVDKWEFAQAHGADGLFELSSVGFSADNTVAIVYAGYDCGAWCGTWALHVLKKTDGKWREVASGTGCKYVS
jgi:hypothetical protein